MSEVPLYLQLPLEPFPEKRLRLKLSSGRSSVLQYNRARLRLESRAMDTICTIIVEIDRFRAGTRGCYAKGTSQKCAVVPRRARI